jgi:hypothetical protein
MAEKQVYTRAKKRVQNYLLNFCEICLLRKMEIKSLETSTSTGFQRVREEEKPKISIKFLLNILGNRRIRHFDALWKRGEKSFRNADKTRGCSVFRGKLEKYSSLYL